MEITVYQEELEDSMINLILSIQNGEFGIPVTIDEQPDLKAVNSFYQTGKGNFWVAVAEGEVVGTIGLKDIGENRAALRKMFVHPGWRGKQAGVAQQLLQTVFDWGEAASLTDIYLGTTDKFLAAHRFYEKNGFVRIKQTKLPATFPIMKVDTIFYHYTFVK
ncbi:MAG: GNAT family N-acetyltransferase [Chitinophagaceae bacterium]|nr:MAG: GNAT family N-acetyltransferase [Chitinophagaceae bacterium]